MTVKQLDKRSQSEKDYHYMMLRNGSAILVAAACMLGSPHALAEETVSDPASEIAHLKQKLEEAEKENALLRQALIEAPAPESATADHTFSTSTETADAAAVTAGDDAKSEPEPQIEVKNLSEVVVTSRRKEEKLQEVPVPITVLGGKNLERDRTLDVQDLTRRSE